MTTRKDPKDALKHISDHHSTHTPGEWEVMHGKHGSVVFCDAGTICKLSNEMAAYKQNGDLIAASPDMLAALTDLLGDMPFMKARGQFECECIHCGRIYAKADALENCDDDCPGEIARAAIAKAKGE